MSNSKETLLEKLQREALEKGLGEIDQSDIHSADDILDKIKQKQGVIDKDHD